MSLAKAAYLVNMALIDSTKMTGTGPLSGTVLMKDWRTMTHLRAMHTGMSIWRSLMNEGDIRVNLRGTL